MLDGNWLPIEVEVRLSWKRCDVVRIGVNLEWSFAVEGEVRLSWK